MMEAEIGAIATALLGGLVVGGGLSLWRSAKEQDEKCEFLGEMKQDLTAAFEGADKLLADSRTPSALQAVLLMLLHAFGDEKIGRSFAKSTFIDDHTANEPFEDNPLSVAMRRLADTDPSLERTAHRTLISLSMGLLVVYFGDGLKAKRVEREMATDPDSVWSRLGGSIGVGRHGSHAHA